MGQFKHLCNYKWCTLNQYKNTDYCYKHKKGKMQINRIGMEIDFE